MFFCPKKMFAVRTILFGVKQFNIWSTDLKYFEDIFYIPVEKKLRSGKISSNGITSKSPLLQIVSTNSDLLSPIRLWLCLSRGPPLSMNWLEVIWLIRLCWVGVSSEVQFGPQSNTTKICLNLLVFAVKHAIAMF